MPSGIVGRSTESERGRRDDFLMDGCHSGRCRGRGAGTGNLGAHRPTVRAWGGVRYGRLLTRVRQPGLTFLLPFRIDRLTLVNTQIVTMSVPAQDGITRDNVSVTVDAVVYFRVVDPGEGRGQRPEIPLRGVPGGADLAAVGHRAA